MYCQPIKEYYKYINVPQGRLLCHTHVDNKNVFRNISFQVCYTTRPQWSPFNVNISMYNSLRNICIRARSHHMFTRPSTYPLDKISWRYVQRKNVVNNVDKSRLKAPWQIGSYRNKHTGQHKTHRTPRRNRQTWSPDQLWFSTIVNVDGIHTTRVEKK